MRVCVAISQPVQFVQLALQTPGEPASRSATPRVSGAQPWPDV